MSDRPAIPSELRRRVLIEAGHRCAIPTCRNIDVDIHHIIYWSVCKKHEYENLIALCPICHRRVHRNEIDKTSLRIYKANLRFTHDRFSQLEVDVLFECAKQPTSRLLWSPTVQLMIKRLIESGFIHYFKAQGGVSTMGMNLSPDHIQISEKGLNYYNSLGEIKL